MKEVVTPVKVTAKDILYLDFIFCSIDDSLMSFAINLDEHSGISMILLRSVLECFGDYEIVSQSEYTDYDEEDQYGNSLTYEVYHTNLPKENFIEVVGEEVSIEDWSDREDEFVDVEM